MKNKVIVPLFLLVATSHTPVVNAAGYGSAFSKGSTSISIVAGSGSSFNNNYVILGVGAGYYVFNGLEIGIDLQHWFSGEPSITKVSPQIKYVFTQPKIIKPYIGAFYRRTYIENFENENAFGYRAGAYFSSNNGVYVGGGIVYEEYQDCSRFVDCSTSYPEVLISVSF
jgi:hypothetical protein